MGVSHGGARIGPKIAVLVSQATVATHQKLLSTKHKLAMMVFNSMSDEISAEVDTTLGPILRDMADKYDREGPMAGFLDFIANGHGQWKAIVGAGVSASGILWSLGTIMNNELAPLVYDTIQSNPHMVPDMSTIANLTGTGRVAYATGVHAMAQNGYPPFWAEAMIDGGRSYPDQSEALEMLRRGLIGLPEFIALLQKNGIPDDIAALFADMANVPLSPADGALAVLRGNLDHASAQEAANAYGVSNDDFNVLVNNTGEPLGLAELLEAYRRGFIDQTRLEHGILQSRVRNEWIDVALKLRYSPMSVSDAVNAVVQNEMDMGDGESIAQQNGLQPGQFETLYNTAGEPLSRTEMGDLYNRGYVSAEEVNQAFSESRHKNKYREAAFQLHTRLLEPRMLAETVRYGSMTHADGVHYALQFGYSPKDAEVLISQASKAKLQSYKERVVASAEALYEDSAISRDQMLTVAKSMGFEDTEAEFVTEAADYRRQAKTVSGAINAVKSKFIAHHVSGPDASGLLDALGVPAAQRDYLLEIWAIEASGNPRELTTAQIRSAVNKDLITADEGMARLQNAGYTEMDASLILAGA